MEKIQTGVQGLDELLKGGVTKNSSVLITGVPGTGKTILGMQFLFHGAELGEPGLFVTHEELEDFVLNYAETLGMDFRKYVEQGLITVVNQPVIGKVMSFAPVMDIIKKKKIKRVFLDSITLFEIVNFDDVSSFRKEILEFVKTMKRSSITFFATSEKSIASIDDIKYSPQDFLFEGLILLTRIRRGASFERCVSIIKMRGQSHLMGIYPFNITEKGIIIYPNQIPFSLTDKRGF